MQIIIPLVCDPAETILQGNIIGDNSIGGLGTDNPIPSIFDPILQGWVLGDYDMKIVIPAAMIGQHDWYGIKPRQIGPMRMAAGMIEMLDIGVQPVNLFVDPIQRWLGSAYSVDKAGMIDTLYDPDVLGASEPIAQLTLAGPGPIVEPAVTIPRGAIFRSGLIKRTTAPVLPASFGAHTVTLNFYQTTEEWFITVTVRDESSNIIVGASVYLMQSDNIEINPDVYGNPINQSAVTDSNGQCMFQISANTAHQIMGYKTGVPDKSGLSLNTTMGNATVTLYIKDPSSPGGGTVITSWAY